MTDVRINPSGISEWERSSGVRDLLQRLGDDIAEDARRDAPKRSGEGATSIHAETGTDADGPFVRVSWDQTHFYMVFSELGTSRQPATPFLRPAAQTRRRY